MEEKYLEEIRLLTEERNKKIEQNDSLVDEIVDLGKEKTVTKNTIENLSKELAEKEKIKETINNAESILEKHREEAMSGVRFDLGEYAILATILGLLTVIYCATGSVYLLPAPILSVALLLYSYVSWYRYESRITRKILKENTLESVEEDIKRTRARIEELKQKLTVLDERSEKLCQEKDEVMKRIAILQSYIDNRQSEVDLYHQRVMQKQLEAEVFETTGIKNKYVSEIKLAEEPNPTTLERRKD